MKSSEKFIQKLIFLCGAVSVITVVLITVFIFISGFPAIKRIGIIDFVFGTNWSPTNGDFGILPLIAGTLGVTLGALLIGIPTGVSCAVLLAEMLGKKRASLFKRGIEILAGIPSVVYGFFGVAIIVPAVRQIGYIVAPDKGAPGLSLLAGSIILAIMILPTIVSLSENAISSVPKEYKEASLALGANKAETIVKVTLPAAKSGIFSSIILGMGRAIGETMAVLLITGNVAQIPTSPLDPVSTLTGTIAMEMSYASPLHQQALFAIGIVLFIVIVILNAVAQKLMTSFGGK
ncbi:MAG: phosphate ABC transporter permease subunit PstC [Anaerovoracaceae bacterium]